jgi:outer membrane receptor protein involved in Fe transport
MRSMRNRGLFVLAFLAALFMATGVFAQTTGTIEGTVVDEKGAPLPGVMIEATSPSLQGNKVATSDTNGNFRMVFLPPGDYTVKGTLSGFATTEQADIKVGLGRTVTVHMKMQSAFKEQIVVTGQAPTIDVRSTEMGTNFDKAMMEDLASGRNYAAIMSLAPGTATDGSGNTVYGSTGAENSYYIDGVNTTGVLAGQQGKSLNMEFVEEMQVKTGGYAAEYGRATGGIVNVITKSGGNEFHGDVFGYYDPSKFQSNTKAEVDRISAQFSRSSVLDSYKRADYGVDIGGFLMKDKLWFFGAYDYVKNDTDNKVAKDFAAYGGENRGFLPFGAVFTDTFKRNLWSGKLTYRATQNHSFVISAFGDPSKETGPLGPTYATNMAGLLGTDETGGTDWTAKYEGVLGSNVVVDARYSSHREKTVSGGTGFNNIATIDYTHPLYLATGTTPVWDGWGYATNQQFGRDAVNGDLSYFLANFGGDHEFKFGVEYEKILINNMNYNTGGQRIYVFRAKVNGVYQTYYRHRFYMTKTPPGGNKYLIDNSYIANPLVVDTDAKNYAAYLQDSWKLSTNLTLNLGVRWERQQMFDKDHVATANLNKEWAPRLGFIWDPKGNGKSKVYGSWGYFYETIPSDMVIRSFGSEISEFSYNFHGAFNDPNRDTVACDPAANALRSCSTLGTAQTPVDPNLGGQYIQEFVLGGETEVATDWVVGGKYIYRNLARVIEDALTKTGGYFIGNPSQGIQDVDFDMNGAGPYAVPRAKRTFKGFEIDVRKRFSNNWQFMASYLYSKLEGSYDGTFQASTGQLDPNINSAYDYAEFQVNNNGYLSNDRRHQVKLDGSYTAPFGLTVGLSTYWRSGTPVTAYGYSAAYQNWEFYLSERGAFGRTNNEYEADVHLGYPLKLAKGINLNLLVDVFNVLNRQGETGRNERYDLGEDYEVINYAADGTSKGTFVAPIKPGDPKTPPTNPAFNTTNTWQAPRSIRLGVRLSF